MENLILSLSFNKSIYSGGGLICACLRISPLDSCRAVNISSSQNMSAIKIQAYGIIIMDPKWSRLPNLSHHIQEVTPTNGFILDSISSAANIQSGNTNQIFFMSSIEDISCIDYLISTSSGTIIEFELPIDALPSQKGLSFSISYNIGVEIYDSCKRVKHFTTFPIQVLNSSPITFPYFKRFAMMSSLMESSLSSLHIPISSHDRENSQYIPNNLDPSSNDNTSSSSTFKIADIDFICSMQLDNMNAKQICPGRNLVVKFNFNGCRQSCDSIKARIVQSEFRHDGSIVQDKIICCASRSTVDAGLLYLRLNIPQNIPISFDCPFAKTDFLYHRIRVFHRLGAGSKRRTWESSTCKSE